MGLFVAMSGVIGSTADEISKVFEEYTEDKRETFELISDETVSSDIGVISNSKHSTTIIYPDNFMEWDDASKFLSEKLQKPVFSLHIHDGDLWMYVLFNNGVEVDSFNPIPEYWNNGISDEERNKWAGKSAVISELIPDLSEETISKYLKAWDVESDNEEKAYESDEFTYGDCWQICDFMQKLNLEYPVDDIGNFLGSKFFLGRKKRKAPRMNKPNPQVVVPGLDVKLELPPTVASKPIEVEPEKRTLPTQNESLKDEIQVKEVEEKKPWWKFW